MGKSSESTISLHSKKFVQELLSALQHEIRNDITNIQSNSYFLYRKITAPSSESDDYMQKINVKADKILRQIGEMNDIFQILNNSFALKITNFNLILFVEDIGESMKSLFPKKKLTITTPGERSLMINGDKQRLEMLIRRLISHTNEYSSPQSITGVELSQKDHHIEIAIWPYEEDKREHHKKPVHDTSINKKFNLLNIELAIYEEIIKHHKGSIEYVRTVTGDLAIFIMIPLHSLPS
jgi:signal transduction histidine kinase